MTDYGHRLEFGTFLTPTSRDPEHVVGLAERTEAAGLDLATFQDHPYNPELLDTWTLLGWVASRTERLRVAGNVLNLPLRHPTVLARAAAGLDLLSRGRVELGLGAGGFREAVQGMGGARRTAGESVDALSEAIDLIRAVWDVDSGGEVRSPGPHYPVPGTPRGPRPHHDIGIWLGAYKPRMLGLVGAKADGWLPSLGYLDLADLPEGNRIIDESAEAAGRDPRQIRRLLNLTGTSFSSASRGFLQGPPEQWVEQLLPLVLEQGVATFVLGGDDPRAIDLFGREVAPALREAVEGERAVKGTPTGPARPVAALAARRPGIDYDAVPVALRDLAVEPGDGGYTGVRHGYMQRGRPGLVLRPTDPEQVAAALAYAREQEVPLNVRSGGHGISGASTNDGGVVIDLGRMNGVRLLDPDTGRVRLGTGARWGDVARTLGDRGWAISSGDHGGVGVGGIATTGGVGYMSRAHGLTIDRLTAVELVTADGRLLRVDEDHEPELFWGMRGAGANLGVVTAVEIEAAPVGNVVLGRFVYDASATASFLRTWGEIADAAPREVTAFLTLGADRGGRGPVAQAMVVYAGEDTDAAVTALEPFLKAGPVLDQRAQVAPYAALLVPHQGPHEGHGTPVSRSGLIGETTPEIAEIVAAMIASGDSYFTQFRQVGGAVNDMAPEATAYAHRSARFSVAALGARAGRLDRHWSALEPRLQGMYLSFDTRTGPEVLAQAFPEPTLSRLRALKAVHDPDRVFDQNFPIPPA
ncbi:LLM class flavin-dependent oxidoreductase [Nocardiopsis alba]|uniref:LLM class flavin-dependent oxidoreductase n=1 Tax=Nocardiopsis alba TaxID=53437 RepID=UPI00366D3020